MLILTRHLFALALTAATGFGLWHFPVYPAALATALLVYLAVLARWPWAWLVVLPALLPVLDLTPVSGRVYLDAFDFFVLATLAAGLWRQGGAAAGASQDGAGQRGLTLGAGAWMVVALFAGAQALATARGTLPLDPIDANAFHSYLSPYNGLRVAKGTLWALLLLPMVAQARTLGVSVGRTLSLGMCLGLAGAIASVVWERALFPGLLDFDENYRVAGFFSGMHTGAPGIDAYLAAALPFAAACFSLWRGRAVRLAGALLLAGGLYAVMVTFTRASYLALAASAAAMALAWGLGHAAHLERRRLLVRGSLVLLAAALIAWPVLTGEFARSRLGAIGEDLRARGAGLAPILDLMAVDPAAGWIGTGKGTFPRLRYLAEADENRLSTYHHLQEDGNGFVRFSPSDPSGGTRIRQRFTVDEPGPYRLDVDLRALGDKTEYLLVEFCEQQIIQPSRECRWIVFGVEPKGGAWVDYHRPFSVEGLGERHRYGARPVEVAVLNRGLKDGVDVDNIQIVTPSGRRLLANGDFEAGLDRWFSEWKQHQAFHIHNLFVETYFEGGLLGLLSLVLLLAYAGVRLARRALARDPMAVILAGSLTGLLVIGMFHSLLDDPRVFVLLLLPALLALMPAEAGLAARTAGPPLHWQPASLRRQPWPVKVVATALLAATVGTALLGIASRGYDVTPRYILLRAFEKLGLDSSALVSLVLPAPRFPEHRLATDPLASRPRLFPAAGAPTAQTLSCGQGGLLGAAACWATTGAPDEGRRLASALADAYVDIPDPGGSPGNGRQVALAYDLLGDAPLLDREARTRIEGRLQRSLRYALLLLDEDDLSLWHGRAALASAAWIIALSLGPEPGARADLLRQAEAHFLDAMRALALTEGWPGGYGDWVNNHGQLVALAGLAYLTGMPGSPHAPLVRQALEGAAYWTLYATRPDDRIEGLGDEASRVDLKYDTQPIVDLLARATGDPVIAWYSDFLASRFGTEATHRDHGWLSRLSQGSSSPAAPTTLATAALGLPLARLFGPDALQLAYVRSGWGPDDTFVSFRAGASFTHHGHYDAGHFSLFKGAPLAVNSSTYGDFFGENRLGYAIRSIAKNTLLVLRPGEQVPAPGLPGNVADGGQRVTLPTGSAVTSVSDWLRNLQAGPHLEGGRVVRYEHEEGSHTYLLADLTEAYNTPRHDEGGEGGKVRRVLRHLLYLADEDRLVVYDEVTAVRPEYVKKWLLHTVRRPEAQGLRVLKGSPDNGILETDADRLDVANGRGRLTVRRLLPDGALVRLVGGPDYRYYVETDGDEGQLDGRNLATGASDRPWFDVADWRIEIQPPSARERDEFLVVLTPSLDQPRPDTVAPLEGGIEGVTGAVTDRSLVIVAARGHGDAGSFRIPDGRRVVRVFAPGPGAAVRLEWDGGEETVAAGPGGVARFDLPPGVSGPASVSFPPSPARGAAR